MSSLINVFRQLKVNKAFENLHDTFSREITVYKNAKQVSIASSPQYNSIYGNSGSTNSVRYEEVVGTFLARIYYLKSEEDIFADNSQAQNKIIIPNGSVKIVVDPVGYNFIKEARKVQFDGNTFSIKSDGNPMGLFANQYFEFYLTPIDEQ
jgi:hypothetical protein